MKDIFATAALIGHLGPYLTTLSAGRRKAAQLQWEINMKGGKRREPLESN